MSLSSIPSEILKPGLNLKEKGIMSLSSIPSEIITEILTMLPVRSILRFRSVSKTWRDTVDSFQFATMQLSRTSSSADTKTSFIFSPSRSNECRDEVHLVELINSDSCVFKTTKLDFTCPDAAEGRFYANPYANGLMCFCSDTSRGVSCFACIYNPSTKDCVKLSQITTPPLQLKKPTFVVPGFGFHESNNEYKVLQMFYYFKHDGFIETIEAEGRVFTLGSKSWRRLENVPNVLCYQITSSATVNGYLHWFTAGKNIVSFDLASESFGFIAYPQFTVLSKNGRGYDPSDFKVLNLGGCFSICDASYADHIELWIMKEYNVHESWTKLIISRAYGVDGMPFTTILPISIWKNGEILLLYDSRILVLYDIESDQYTLLRADGIPEHRAENEFRRRSMHCNSYGNYEVYQYVGNLMSLKSLCKIKGTRDLKT